LIIDFARIGIYTQTIDFHSLAQEKNTLIFGVFFAFIGTYFGRQLIKKTTLRSIQKVVGVFLFTLGILFILGVL
jgi:small-conductance mechanosensitive channel